MHYGSADALVGMVASKSRRDVGAPICYLYLRINPTSTPNISSVPCGRITG